MFFFIWDGEVLLMRSLDIFNIYNTPFHIV
uniref:Uncharacterized protein n=1 Tax=viral metagenome TaxID=1070528 RepID=A0A6C0AFF3_9ZZZZ